METPGRRRAAVLLVGAALLGVPLLVSGDDRADPRTPPALPGMPPPFLGTAVVGDGGLTGAVDAYGSVVDLRAGPAGPALIDNPFDRQVAGTVPPTTGIVPRLRVDGEALGMGGAKAIEQRYRPGTNVVRTVGRFKWGRVAVTAAAHGDSLALAIRATEPVLPSFGIEVEAGIHCSQERGAHTAFLLCDRGELPGVVHAHVQQLIAGAGAEDRRWLRQAKPLGAGAPPWAAQMYERSLLVLHALTDRRSGAVAAGARDGWAYVWPRDAGAAAIALGAAEYKPEAQRITRFLLGLDLEGAARFHGDGSPVGDRAAQGDEVGWVAVTAEAAGVIGSTHNAARIPSQVDPVPWRDRADYWEGESGDFLANAIASGEPPQQIETEFGAEGGLSREAGAAHDFDSAAAWALRPFTRSALSAPARRTLLRLAEGATPFGLLPGEGWEGGEDPWSAPTAWSAWALAALAREEQSRSRARGDRRVALDLLQALRRSATPAGALPERVDLETGIPRSTTPLTWSHAFAILALGELWPSRSEGVG